MKYQYGIQYTYVYPEDTGIKPYTDVLHLTHLEDSQRMFEYVEGNKNTKDVKIVKRKVGEWEDA